MGGGPLSMPEGLIKAVGDWDVIVDNLHESIITTGADGYIVSWNKGAERLFGYTAEEAVGLHADICHQRSHDALQQEVIEPLQRDGRLEIFGKMVRKSGEVFDGHMLASLIKAPDGTITGMIGYTLDITERKQAETALRNAHADLERRVAQRTLELQTTLETVIEGVITIDDRGRVETFNPSAEIIFGYRADEVFGQNVAMLMPSDDRNHHDRYISKYLTTGESGLIGVGREVLGQRKDGSVFHMRLGVGEMKLGGVQKFAGTVQDITEQKAAQAALQESERNLRNLTELSPVGIYRADLSGKITYANERALKIAGSPDVESPYLGNDWHHFIYPEDRDKFVSKFLSAVKTKRAFSGEYRFGTANGPVTWALSQAVPEFNPDGVPVGYMGTLTDISESKMSGAILRESEALLDTITSHSPVALVRSDREGLVTFVNDTYLQLLGRDRKSVLRDGWAASVHPEDAVGVQEAWYRYVKSGDAYAREFRIVPPSGPAVWVFGQSAPVRDHDGRVLGHVGTLTDITDRKKAENDVVAAMEKAETANRAKSVFLSSMSHELRTPMNAILGFAQLLEQDATRSLDDTSQAFVAEILRSGQHMLELINDVLDLAKIESGDVSIDLTDQSPETVITTCVDMMSATAKQSDITLSNRTAKESLPLIRADTLRLRQTLLNLLSNAVKYNHAGGEIIVECGPGEAGTLRIRVTDTGIGIPEAVHDRVFEPFDRLGAESSDTPGTGVGLSVSKRLIESMGGAIGFESDVDKGTTFWIDVPLAT